MSRDRPGSGGGDPARDGGLVELVGLLALALVAGALSFTSPCVLPLLPGYVAYVSRRDDAAQGSADDPAQGRGGSGVAVRRRLPDPGAVLFVAGFGVVFVVLGLTASALGLLLRQHLDTINRVGGVVVIVLGLAMTGLVRLPGALSREYRPGLRRAGAGRGGAFVLGAAFAFGWTPCVGPVLSTVLVVAASSGRLPWGALLLATYALGLGLPFVLLARLVRRGGGRLRVLRANARRLEVVGGLVLVGTGLLMVSGLWTALMAGALAQYARLGWPPI